jgi:hypothetical protein
VLTDKDLGLSQGPTDEELENAATRAVIGSWDESDLSSSWMSGDAESDDSDVAVQGDLDDEGDLLDAVEQVYFLDAHLHDDM